MAGNGHEGNGPDDGARPRGPGSGADEGGRPSSRCTETKGEGARRAVKGGVQRWARPVTRARGASRHREVEAGAAAVGGGKASKGRNAS